jgi:7-carboxy-7-deazaguanine synthase
MTKQQWEEGFACTDEEVRVNNIFLTIDGETNQWHQGSWSVFIRLQGCRVGCTWCDTKHTWSIKHGTLMRPAEIVQRVHTIGRGTKHVTLTGGEPTEQAGPALSGLLARLLAQSFRVSMETSGTLDLRPWIAAYRQVNYIADFKLPSAGARFSPHLMGLAALRATDVIKFVAYYNDLPEVFAAAEFLRAQQCKARFVVSPVMPACPPADLPMQFVERMKALDFPAMEIGLNLQMHKYIWTENVRDEESPSPQLPLISQQS